jgi:putative tricarboxylic transport membrane protein
MAPKCAFTEEMILMDGHRSGRRPVARALYRWLAGLLLLVLPAIPALAAQDRLTLVVPAAPGGGWDQTAKVMREAILAEDLAKRVDIVRYPGSGGLIGLAQFVNRYRGQNDALFVGGLALVGAAITQDAAVSLRDVSPVARLSGDWDLIVVRADSPIHSVDELATAMRQNPATVRWSGGAVGGADQALAWNIAKQIGVPLDDVLYYGKAGGGSVAKMLLDRRSDVAIGGYSEFAPYMASGTFRAIAVGAPRRIKGLDIPTLRESGIDVAIMNWRGVFAAPGLGTGQQEQLAHLVAAMASSPVWRRKLDDARWTDAYLDGEAFTRFIDRETARWPEMINPPPRGKDHSLSVGGFSDVWLYLLCGLVAVLATAAVELLWLLRRRKRNERELESRCGALSVQLVEAEDARDRGVINGIQQDFGDWNLSAAERDVAWFMLRGLPLRQIAGLRGTSERTVRQQAQAIYRKAGLDSRSDLAGRVLERFI